MRYLIILMLVLVGCGQDLEVKTEDRMVEVQKEVFRSQDFEGFWYCENGSTLELMSDYQDRITFETISQSLISLNFDGGTGIHALLSDRDVVINNNKLVMAPRNVTYSSTSNDIERDGTTSNITGSRRTDIAVKLKTVNSLVINIKIYNASINGGITRVDANRTFNCTL